MGRGAAAAPEGGLPASIRPGHTAPSPATGGGTAGTDSEVIQARLRWDVLENGVPSARVTPATEPLPHAASWLCIMLLLSSICNFSNGLYGSNCSRKALMQSRPRRDAAAGHSVALITAASLGAGSCLSLARAGLPPCMETPGHTGVSLGSEGMPGGAWGGPRSQLSTSGVGRPLLVEGLSIPLHSLVLPGCLCLPGGSWCPWVTVRGQSWGSLPRTA